MGQESKIRNPNNFLKIEKNKKLFKIFFFFSESARRHPQRLEVLQYQGHVRKRRSASEPEPIPRLKQIT